MSSFFTTPASQRKRKRPTAATSSRSGTGATSKKQRQQRDESISGSEIEDVEESSHTLSMPSSDDEKSEDEDATGRQTRLAQQYLENTRREVLAAGFDAKDLDDELLAQRMGQRLKEDTAESKGRLYRWVADDYECNRTSTSKFSNGSGVITGISVQHPYIYTVSKDLRLSKWEATTKEAVDSPLQAQAEVTRKLKLVSCARGDRSRRRDTRYEGHTNEICCVAASADGRFVATGGKDKKLVVWDAATLKPLRAFTQHRHTVTSLCFRRGTNELFTASRDRTVKIWSLNELAYVETLYGHQDEILDVASLNQEHCVTAGARDRTARYWRVLEESQLVFRGGGAPNSLAKKARLEDGGAIQLNMKLYYEGSTDRVSMLDEETFITGSDNGSISLWSINKKKAVFTWPAAHGVEDPMKPDEFSAEVEPKPELVPDPQARAITALVGLPYANVFFTGSWDGCVRAWKITEDKRSIESIGPVMSANKTGGNAFEGVVNDLSIGEVGKKGKEDLILVAAVGKEPRMGRWKTFNGRNTSIYIKIPRRQ